MPIVWTSLTFIALGRNPGQNDRFRNGSCVVWCQKTGKMCEAAEQKETYFPSTAATTLHAILCSYSALSMRSRRSFRLFKFIMNTYVGGDSSESELSDSWWRGLGFMRSARRNRPKKGAFFCRLHLPSPCPYSPHQSPFCQVAFWGRVRIWRASRGDFALHGEREDGCRKWQQLCEQAALGGETGKLDAKVKNSVCALTVDL